MFRRTLEEEDLIKASDDELDDLLTSPPPQSKDTFTEVDVLEDEEPTFFPQNGITKAPILDLNATTPVEESGEEDDDDENMLISISTDANQNATNSTTKPKNKSVRFMEPLPGKGEERENKTSRLKAQVSEVRGIMRDNISRLLDREANLGNLDDMSDEIRVPRLRDSSSRSRRKIWWKQQRNKLVIGALAIILAALIIIPVVSKLLST